MFIGHKKTERQAKGIKFFDTKSYYIIIISFQPDVVDLMFFKLWIMLDQIIKSLKYQRVTASGCKDIKIRKPRFVAKSQFLF